MKPTVKQKKWLKEHLPKGAEPIDMIPRAYCVAKPTPKYAVFITPRMDYRKPLVDDSHSMYHTSVVLNTSVQTMLDVDIGFWKTVVYCEFKNVGSWWEYTTVIPLKGL